MNQATEQKTVFVGLSGGVDSSVAAARLIDQGYNVVGVFIKVWHPDFMICNWEAERLDAMRVAAHLEIPFLTCDAEAAYRDDVAHYFIEEYRAGRTPNPDVMCNQHVKFGRFLEFAQEKGADYIATGHYVQRIDDAAQPEMHRGIDQNKDQTYFLWSLSKKQLARSLFPVGDSPKETIRTEAAARGIPVATKKDSQGICFLGHVDIPEFLGHYIDLTEGEVITSTGDIIGTHQGALVYTLGQRHGFTIKTEDENRKPYFVVAKDIEHNQLVVDTEISQTEAGMEINLAHVVLRANILVGDTLEMQFRYRQKPVQVTVVAHDSNCLSIVPVETVEMPAAGQSCVLYVGSLCLGGGIVA